MRWHVLNLRILKSGGNGDVFVGERSDTGDQVVVKFLRESDSAFARKSFEREVRILTFGFPGMVRFAVQRYERGMPLLCDALTWLAGHWKSTLECSRRVSLTPLRST